ncbi:MAG: hypothetical protein ACLTJB_04100, partial [Holdemania filiformis]
CGRANEETAVNASIFCEDLIKWTEQSEFTGFAQSILIKLYFLCNPKAKAALSNFITSYLTI